MRLNEKGMECRQMFPGYRQTGYPAKVQVPAPCGGLLPRANRLVIKRFPRERLEHKHNLVPRWLPLNFLDAIWRYCEDEWDWDEFLLPKLKRCWGSECE